MSSSSVRSADVGSDPDPSLVDPAARPVRRTFPAEYRARILAEYEAAPRGEKAAVLRREGLYQSHVQKWAAARKADARGVRPQRNSHQRSGKAVGPDVDRLVAENARLSRELQKSQAVVEIMGKLQGLLEAISESTDTPAPPRQH